MKELTVSEMQEVNGGGNTIVGDIDINPDIVSPILFGGKLAGGVELCGGSTISIIVIG